MKTLLGFISGRVQGVGFRYFIKHQAEHAGINGYVKNLPDGRVEFLLQGDDELVEHVLKKIHHGPAMAIIEEIDVQHFDTANRLISFDIN